MAAKIKIAAFLGALILGMLPLPDSSSQWQFCSLLLVSMILMAWWGHIALHRVGRGAAWIDEAFFLKACLGQFVLLFMWAIASPVLFLLQKLLHFSYLFAVAMAVAVIGSLVLARSERKSFIRSMSGLDAGRIAFYVLAAACIFKMAVYYSVRSGALGLDTHQHIFFVTDIYQAGYLKPNAGTTSWLEQYPKGLHAISALWGWPGLGDHLGSFVKVMPALQSMLVIFSFAEICAMWLYRNKPSELQKAIWWALIAVGLAYELYRGTRLIYPIADLNSTGRISSAAVLFIPSMAGCLFMMRPARASAALAAAILPFAGAVAAKFNPSLCVAFLAVSLPMWLATVSPVVWRHKILRRTAAYSFAAGTVVGSGLLFLDPFYLALLASKSPSLAMFLEKGLGLKILPQAAMDAGIVSGISASGFVKAVLGNMTFASGLLASVIPESSMVISHKLLSLTRIAVWAGIAIWMYDRFVLSRDQEASYRSGGAALVILQVSLLAGTWFNSVMGLAISEVVGTATIQASVLSTYAREFSGILVLFALPIHLALTTALMTLCLQRVLGASQAWWKWISAAVTVGIALSARVWTIPEAPPAEKMGWWQPIKESQIDAFQEFERKIPKDAVVLAEATAVTLNGREEWILPIGESAAYLPFAERHYLFNVRLGDGYRLSSKDLSETFCRGSADTVKEFIRRNNVRYFFTVVPDGQTEQQLLDKTYCGVKYSTLGLVFPPYIKGEGGLTLFELRR